LATLNQKTKIFYKKPVKNKKPKLNGSPQRRAVVLRLRICTPRKPNSARRPAVKLRLSTKKKSFSTYTWKWSQFKKIFKSTYKWECRS